MKRIFQTIIAGTALLLCVQGAQASNRPVNIGFDYQNIGAFAPGDILDAASADPTDSQPVSWFEFNLTETASVELDTEGSRVDSTTPFVVFDSILALYDNDGMLIDQNDNCPTSGDATSCLFFGELGIGSYYAGVSSPTNGPFLNDWLLTGSTVLTANIFLYVKVAAPSPSPVPVPAAFWLFGTALIGFVGMSRRTSVKS